MSERTLRVKVADCGNRAPSWWEGVGGCTCVTTVCRSADDGYHQHQLRVGDAAYSRLVVTHHLHTWLRELGNPAPVSVERPRAGVEHTQAGLAEVWPPLAQEFGLDGDLPAIACQYEQVTPVG